MDLFLYCGQQDYNSTRNLLAEILLTFLPRKQVKEANGELIGKLSYIKEFVHILCLTEQRSLFQLALPYMHI